MKLCCSQIERYEEISEIDLRSELYYCSTLHVKIDALQAF